MELTTKRAVTGGVGGFLSGLLGIGGGTAMVPLLVLWGGVTQRDAHAFSLAAIIPISIAALAVYGGAGQIALGVAAALTFGAVVGARIGAGILSRLPEHMLKLLFGGFMLVAAALIVTKG